jgi:hypothetical protein
MMTEYGLVTLLKERYPKPEYALFPQVRNGTGFRRGTVRTADAVALSLYPSRGIHLHGFEIKVTKSDWRRELKEPDKAESICSFCDFWWIVAPENVVDESELPLNWGLIVERDGKLRQKKQSPMMTAKPLDKLFIASLCRSAQECLLSDAELVEAKRRSFDEGYKAGSKMWEERYEREKKSHQEYMQRVHQFENDSGVQIANGWRMGNVAHAVRLILEGGLVNERSKLEQLASSADQIAVYIREALKVEHAA